MPFCLDVQDQVFCLKINKTFKDLEYIILYKNKVNIRN